MRKRGILAVYSIRKVKEKASCLEKDGLIAKKTIIFMQLIKELQCRRIEFVHNGSRAQNQNECVKLQGPRKRSKQLSHSSQELAISGVRDLHLTGEAQTEARQKALDVFFFSFLWICFFTYMRVYLQGCFSFSDSSPLRGRKLSPVTFFTVDKCSRAEKLTEPG